MLAGLVTAVATPWAATAVTTAAKTTATRALFTRAGDAHTQITSILGVAVEHPHRLVGFLGAAQFYKAETFRPA